MRIVFIGWSPGRWAVGPWYGADPKCRLRSLRASWPQHYGDRTIRLKVQLPTARRPTELRPHQPRHLARQRLPLRFLAHPRHARRSGHDVSCRRSQDDSGLQLRTISRAGVGRLAFWVLGFSVLRQATTLRSRHGRPSYGEPIWRRHDRPARRPLRADRSRPRLLARGLGVGRGRRPAPGRRPRRHRDHPARPRVGRRGPVVDHLRRPRRGDLSGGPRARRTRRPRRSQRGRLHRLRCERPGGRATCRRRVRRQCARDRPSRPGLRGPREAARLVGDRGRGEPRRAH